MEEVTKDVLGLGAGNGRVVWQKSSCDGVDAVGMLMLSCCSGGDGSATGSSGGGEGMEGTSIGGGDTGGNSDAGIIIVGDSVP